MLEGRQINHSPLALGELEKVKWTPIDRAILTFATDGLIAGGLIDNSTCLSSVINAGKTRKKKVVPIELQSILGVFLGMGRRWLAYLAQSLVAVCHTNTYGSITTTRMHAQARWV
jgi:hypothetical protein